MDDKKFKIDFFEFSFLVEACIPPRPIARSMFWSDVSEVYYHQMTQDERFRLFTWIQKNPCFTLDNEDCNHFYNRFNPDNQFKIYIDFNGLKSEADVYMHDGRYHKSKSTSVVEEYIYKIESIKIVHDD